MGIFTKLFGKTPNHQESWNVITQNISESLIDVRESWFNGCIEVLKGQLSLDNNITFANTHFGGTADLAMRAYQLYHLPPFMVHNSYVSHSNISDFNSIFYSVVGGTKLKECMNYYSRYHKLGHDGGTQQLSSFTFDVAKYITGNQNPMTESIILLSIVPVFIILNSLTAACYFNDQKTIKRLESNLNEFAND